MPERPVPILFSDHATQDLLKIALDRNYGDVEETARFFCQELGKVARGGGLREQRDELGTGVHCHLMPSHLVFYVLNQDQLKVLRIIEELRDYVPHPWP